MGRDPHRRLIDSIGDSPIATVVSNPRSIDNPLEAANPAFCALTGYSESEVVGRNCRFLTGEGTEPWVSDHIRAAIRERRPVLVEILNYRKDGSPFRNGVMISPLFGDDGEVQYFLGSQVDLGDAGGIFASRRAASVATVARLPPRQRQVLQAISKGLLNKQIAHRLGISEKTVKMHRSLLIEKLGAETSADAIRIAVEANL
jgi:PAS domain S-box-containing protein